MSADDSIASHASKQAANNTAAPSRKQANPASPVTGDEKSKFLTLVDPSKYRQPDDHVASCQHGPCVVSCVTSGKAGRNGRTAAVGATIFWLQCPSLNNILARFERHGAIRMLQQRLSEDAALLASHVASHLVYESRVRSILPTEEQRAFFFDQFVQPTDASKRKFGNAGVSHAEDMKCLHALAAQSLGGAPNPIGTAVLLYVADLHAKLNSGSITIADADDFVRFFAFYDSLKPDQLKMSGDELCSPTLCAVTASLLIALEGHEPRARKKHRKN